MKRLLALAVCLFALVGTLPAALAFVRMVLSASPLVCDLRGVPTEVWASCLEFVRMATWGVE